jgi:large-conductance mechanosensitive channel
MDFLNFVEKYDVIGSSVGIIIGTAVTSFAKALSEYFVMPIIKSFDLPFTKDDYSIKLFGLDVEIKLGKLLGELIKLLSLLLIVYLAIRGVVYATDVAGDVATQMIG